MTKLRVYIASKAKHRPRWRAARDNGVNIISRWIDTDDKFTENTEGLDYSKLWDECIEDAQSCDLMIVYIEKGEVLKGALVEIGAALTTDCSIYICGDVTEQGTWWHHDRIQSGGSIDTFFDLLKETP